jgi:tRNA(Ile)-lysidine synthase TilS/MesJ
VLETVILNLSRGTGRKGLTSLSSSNTIRRPLLEFPKADIISYANQQGLEWREDSTNIDQHYRRNYIRHTVMPRLDAQARAKLSRLIEKQRSLNQEIDQQIVNQLHLQDRAGVIKRRYFNRLPHTVSKEVLATWLREQGLRSFDSQMLERLAVTAKTAKPGKRLEVFGGHYILVGKEDLALDTQER